MPPAALERPAQATVSLEAYHLLAEATREKIELVAGRIRAMASGSRNHNTTMLNIVTSISAILGDEGPCELLNSENKLRVPGPPTYLHPDAMIACPPHWISEGRGEIDNPTVVFEVLSPSTVDYDLVEKFALFGKVESVRQVVYLATERIQAIVFRRDGADGVWSRTDVVEDGAVVLASVGLSVSIRALYRRTTLV